MFLQVFLIVVFCYTISLSRGSLPTFSLLLDWTIRDDELGCMEGLLI